MISAAARWISDGFPTRAAMMKSNGEQLTGQAFLQGFSSQYSHLSNSVWSWCLVMILVSTVAVLFHGTPQLENELDFLCQKSQIHYSICQTDSE